MPYKKTSELPIGVHNHLPLHAQKIYLQTFNQAWESYKTADTRHSGSDREETAHKVAWSAVKKTYKKDRSGEWSLKEKKEHSKT